MAAAQAPAHPILDYSFAYGGAASSSGPGPNGTFQYCAVKPDGNDLEVAPSSSAGATISANTRVLGILQTQGPTASTGSVGMACNVRMLGLSKLVVDGGAAAIAPGDLLKNDTSGRGVKTTNASDEIFAMALQNSTSTNDIISVFVLPGQRF